MKKYNFSTGEYEECIVNCEGCGEHIDSQKGYQEKYVENEDGERFKVILGSCCVGKIHAYGSLSKKIREDYKSRGQIPDSVLARLPRAPKPVDIPIEASKPTDNFIDKMGRSKIGKTYDGKIKYKKSKGLKNK